ncbi:MAG: alpha/beta hydrolase-fold protein [Terracidiphilus sp.]
MRLIPRLLLTCLCAAGLFVPPLAAATAVGSRFSRQKHPQETGFLNRSIELRGIDYHFQIYLPEEWRHDDHKEWPIILFLHGRGERGSEGMWQTQIGLPAAVRDHPERWPFIIVMPQCPQGRYWTDSDMMAMAMSALDQETAEFHADPARTYLTALSLGGYGAWELARLNPDRWAAVAIAAGGIFWSYAPERWHASATLPGEYAHDIGHTPIWLFHGSDDNVVSPRESELMFAAFKADGGNIRLWVYQGLKHDCWTRAFDEPDLPRWLLGHRRGQPEPPSAERLFIPLHPPALRLTPAQLESFAGDYHDSHGLLAVTVFRQGDQLYQKDLHGAISELAAESLSTLFYPNGSSISRLIVDRDAQGRVIALVYHDDRHEERWEKRPSLSARLP